jgi:hypothetical protein
MTSKENTPGENRREDPGTQASFESESFGEHSNAASQSLALLSLFFFLAAHGSALETTGDPKDLNLELRLNAFSLELSIGLRSASPILGLSALCFHSTDFTQSVPTSLSSFQRGNILSHDGPVIGKEQSVGTGHLPFLLAEGEEGDKELQDSKDHLGAILYNWQWAARQ